RQPSVDECRRRGVDVGSRPRGADSGVDDAADERADGAEDVAEDVGRAVNDFRAGVDSGGAIAEAGGEVCDGTEIHVMVLSSWAARGCTAPCAVEFLRTREVHQELTTDVTCELLRRHL